MNKTLAIKTLGCKLNQYESEVIREQFERAGYRIVPFDQPADMFVINTCTVTGKSDTSSRQVVRQAFRQNPAASILVTGCYAETDPAIFGKISDTTSGKIIVVGNDRKFSLPEIVKTIGENNERGEFNPSHRGYSSAVHAVAPLLTTMRARTRAFVKIQDGCNYRCTYCKVRLARGKSRSVPLEQVLRQVRVLEQAEIREVVLTGVDIGSYGKDFSPRESFESLLEEIILKTGMPIIRISSFDPADLSDQIIGIIGNSNGRVARHIHLPLQSGSDTVLKKMRRRYRIETYAEWVLKLVDSIPGISIGADVMAGFPGETEKEFGETLKWIEHLPLAYFHPFSYSARPGTPASSMDEQVHPGVSKRRMNQLTQLRKEKIEKFYDSQCGKIHRVLIETAGHDPGHRLMGITDNYLRFPVGGIGRSRANQFMEIYLEKRGQEYTGTF